ncbi:protein CrcB (plasmid) [Sinorhizobium americanum]|uniref:Fluoride-specific ion channel FluC n=2 Tax=Sinorhizobium americanum TaxID=194963 RepID=A0A1L3LUU7_9HYPH|nr:protein CrcB [Sinorhizobium americanum]
MLRSETASTRPWRHRNAAADIVGSVLVGGDLQTYCAELSGRERKKGTAMAYLLVFLGAGLGGVMRHGVNQFAAQILGAAFPFGTLAVNVAGSFAMGLIAEYFALRVHLPQDVRLFLATGVLGGFTTFSSFSLDTIGLYERGEWMAAVIYAASSVVFSLLGLLAGMMLIRLLAAGQTA